MQGGGPSTAAENLTCTRLPLPAGKIQPEEVHLLLASPDHVGGPPPPGRREKQSGLTPWPDTGQAGGQRGVCETGDTCTWGESVTLAQAQPGGGNLGRLAVSPSLEQAGSSEAPEEGLFYGQSGSWENWTAPETCPRPGRVTSVGSQLTQKKGHRVAQVAKKAPVLGVLGS